MSVRNYEVFVQMSDVWCGLKISGTNHQLFQSSDDVNPSSMISGSISWNSQLSWMSSLLWVRAWERFVNYLAWFAPFSTATACSAQRRLVVLKSWRSTWVFGGWVNKLITIQMTGWCWKRAVLYRLIDRYRSRISAHYGLLLVTVIKINPKFIMCIKANKIFLEET